MCVRITGRYWLAKFAAAGTFHWELHQEAVYSHSSFKREPWSLQTCRDEAMKKHNIFAPKPLCSFILFNLCVVFLLLT